MKSMQEVFEEACLHLKNQNRQAINEFHTCSYRAEVTVDGEIRKLKCVVGHFIPDEIYVPWMENRRVPELIEFCAMYGINLPPEIKAYRDLLHTLQNIHDGSSYRNCGFKGIKNDLRGVGVFYELTIPNYLFD